jgi:hypothetical protein
MATSNEGEARLVAYRNGKEFETLYEKVADLQKILELQQEEILHLKKCCWLFAKSIEDIACVGNIDDYLPELEEVINSEE